MKPRWCVKSYTRRNGAIEDTSWCALKVNKQPPENGDHIRAETLCDHFVMLPGAYEKRVPDCPECLEVLYD